MWPGNIIQIVAGIAACRVVTESKECGQGTSYRLLPVLQPDIPFDSPPKQEGNPNRLLDLTTCRLSSFGLFDLAFSNILIK
jgi:hypothetical protein